MGTLFIVVWFLIGVDHPPEKWGTLCCVGSSLKYAFLLEGGKLVLPGRAKKRNDYYRMLLLEL